MIRGRFLSRSVRVPVWLTILAALLTASVIVQRAHAAAMEHDPRVSQLMSGRGIAFALTFDQIVSHRDSRLTLVTSTGTMRNIPVRPVAQPNTLYASIGGLEPGHYVLQWQALAADGTTLRGSLPFKVGQDS